MSDKKCNNGGFFSLLRIGRQLKNNDKGVAALEFALIAPFLITLYMGSAELFHALSADRRVTDLASAAADLTAQSANLTSAQMDNIYSAASIYLKPYGVSALKITVTSICHDSNDQGRVDWSSNYQDGAGGVHNYAHGDDIDLPVDNSDNPVLTIQGTSLILAEVEYTYTSPLGKFVHQTVLSDHYFLRPRLTQTPSVVNTDAGGAATGCADAMFSNAGG